MARRLSPTLLAAAAVMAVFFGCGSSSTKGSEAAPSQPSFAVKKVIIGELEVAITPVRVDSGGAEFEVAFDTHTGAPGLDVAARSALIVDGTPWTAPAWSGDGPGGHHRAGTLRFSAAGPARGSAHLTISGLDRPLEVAWEVP